MSGGEVACHFRGGDCAGSTEIITDTPCLVVGDSFISRGILGEALCSSSILVGDCVLVERSINGPP